MEQIREMESWEGSDLNKAKEILAYELTSLVHGEDEAKKAQSAAKSLFAGGGSAEDTPKAQIDESEATDGAFDVITLLASSGLVGTRSEGRRAIQQGGVSVDGEKITDVKAVVEVSRLKGDGILLKKGKKSFKRIVLK